MDKDQGLSVEEQEAAEQARETDRQVQEVFDGLDRPWKKLGSTDSRRGALFRLYSREDQFDLQVPAGFQPRAF